MLFSSWNQSSLRALERAEHKHVLEVWISLLFFTSTCIRNEAFADNFMPDILTSLYKLVENDSLTNDVQITAEFYANTGLLDVNI